MGYSPRGRKESTRLSDSASFLPFEASVLGVSVFAVLSRTPLGYVLCAVCLSSDSFHASFFLGTQAPVLEALHLGHCITRKSLLSLLQAHVFLNVRSGGHVTVL